jgi:hypothetical protein
MFIYPLGVFMKVVTSRDVTSRNLVRRLQSFGEGSFKTLENTYKIIQL